MRKTNIVTFPSCSKEHFPKAIVLSAILCHDGNWEPIGSLRIFEKCINFSTKSILNNRNYILVYGLDTSYMENTSALWVPVGHGLRCSFCPVLEAHKCECCFLPLSSVTSKPLPAGAFFPNCLIVSK